MASSLFVMFADVFSCFYSCITNEFRKAGAGVTRCNMHNLLLSQDFEVVLHKHLMK